MLLLLLIFTINSCYLLALQSKVQHIIKTHRGNKSQHSCQHHLQLLKSVLKKSQSQLFHKFYHEQRTKKRSHECIHGFCLLGKHYGHSSLGSCLLIRLLHQYIFLCLFDESRDSVLGPGSCDGHKGIGRIFFNWDHQNMNDTIKTTTITSLSSTSRIFCFIQQLYLYWKTGLHDLSTSSFGFNYTKGDQPNTLLSEYQFSPDINFATIDLEYIVVDQNYLTVELFIVESLSWDKEAFSSLIKQNSSYQIIMTSINYYNTSVLWGAQVENTTEILTQHPDNYFSIQYTVITLRNITLDLKIKQISYLTPLNHISIELFAEEDIDLNNLVPPVPNNSNFKIRSFTKTSESCTLVIQYDEQIRRKSQSLKVQFSQSPLMQHEGILVFAKFQMAVEIPREIDRLSILGFAVEVSYVFAFFLALCFDPTTAVDIVLFVQLVFLGQSHISSSVFSKRTSNDYELLFRYSVYYYNSSGPEKALQIIAINCFWTLSVLFPLLVFAPLFIVSKCSKSQTLRGKYQKHSQFILIQWTYAFALFNIYNVVACLVLNLQQFGYSEGAYLSNQLLFIILSIVFQQICRYYRKHKASYKQIEEHSQIPTMWAYLDPLAYIFQIYLIPVFLSACYSAILDLLLTLFTLILLFVHQIRKVKKDSEAEKRRLTVQKLLSIFVVLMYIFVEATFNKNSTYQPWVYDLAFSSILIILFVNLVSNLLFLFYAFKCRKNRDKEKKLVIEFEEETEKTSNCKQMTQISLNACSDIT